jgi:hypothetical protein
MDWLYSDVQMWHLIVVVGWLVGWKIGDWLWPRTLHYNPHIHADAEYKGLPLSYWAERFEGDIDRMRRRVTDLEYARLIPVWKIALSRWIGCE